MATFWGEHPFATYFDVHQGFTTTAMWVWVKFKQLGFSPCSHLPGFHFGYRFLTLSRLDPRQVREIFLRRPWLCVTCEDGTWAVTGRGSSPEPRAQNRFG